MCCYHPALIIAATVFVFVMLFLSHWCCAFIITVSVILILGVSLLAMSAPCCGFIVILVLVHVLVLAVEVVVGVTG
jgi:hypothetical protein